MKLKFENALKSFVPLQLMLLAVFVGMRLYEWAVTTKPEANLTALWYDVACSLFTSGAIFFVYIIVAFYHLRAAIVLSVVLMTIVIIANFLLIRYFSITHIPLSTDLFGYSWNDIQTTARASGNIDFVSVILTFLFPVLFVVGIWYSRRRLALLIPVTFGYVFAAVALMLFLFPVRPRAETFGNDQQYYAVMNKTAYFIQRVTLSESGDKQQIEFKPDDYPFLHEISYRNTIGGYFRKSSSPPNIVFVIVEGLGRDFVGNDSKYGGFTPFIDSLANVGLYWKNGLSNGGRTFAVLPSILGALPYGKEGFLSYAPDFPAHQTLISLLKPYHYYSSFYYGGDSNFDNMDVFLEYQKIDTLVDQGKFPKRYQVAEKNSEGFTWGFSDADLFDWGGQIISNSVRRPRLDIFLTISTHEPFRVPDEKYHLLFDQQLSKQNKKNPVYAEYRKIFECLMYTDNAIRNLINNYRKRPDFDNTIFVITGDHRLIPIPQDTKLSRFHVPIILYSPLIDTPQTFESIVPHSAVPAALLAMFSENFNMHFPEKLPFISDSISTEKAFSSEVELALIRNKNETIDYISGTNFLSEGRLYTITSSMDLEPDDDGELKDKLQARLDSFNARSLFACANNRIDKPEQITSVVEFTFTAREKKLIDSLNLRSLNPDQLFFKARDLAFNKQYPESRIVSRFVLNRSPNYSDARILLARTFAWEHQYDTAKFFLNEVLDRSPNYADAYVALADIAYWQGEHKNSLAIVRRGLATNADNTDLLIREARALYKTGDKTEAKKKINAILKYYPDNELAVQIEKQMN